MSEPTEEQWADIAARLQAPFDPRDVEFRPQGKLTTEGKGRAIAYVDARVVAARLDAVVGAQHWEFYWEPIITDTAVRVVKGTILIYGVSKSDIGDGERTEPSKAAVSDALKRTAVLWGPGRYLYHLEAEWVQGKAGQGENWYIPDAELTRLRGKLPRPAGIPAQAQTVSQNESRVSLQGAQRSNGSQGSTARPTGNQSKGGSADDPLRAAWADFRYIAPQAGFTTEESQKHFIQEYYPDCKPKELTAAEVQAMTLYLRRDVLDLPANDGGEAA